jgi:hypothetical protein
MLAAHPPARDRLRHYSLLLTLAFWALHLLLTYSRGPWLPISSEALAVRQAMVTASGLLLCALQYPVVERVLAWRFRWIAAVLVACATGAGLVNAAAPVAVHWLVTGEWHRDADPGRFMSGAAYWTWVFLAWSALIVALVSSLKCSSDFEPTGEEGAATGGMSDFWLLHRGRRARVPLEEVVRFEAAGDYVLVHVAGRHYMMHASLRSLEKRLDPDQFARVHRGAIVRLAEVSGIERSRTGQQRLRLRNGDAVKVGRTYCRRLKQRLHAR